MAATVRQNLEKAAELHRQSRFAEAEHHYREVLNVEPGNFQARHLFGVARFQQGRNNDALALISDALKINPNDGAALSNYALVLQAQGRNDEALVFAEKSLAALPGSPDSWSNRGNILSSLGRIEAALESYDRALAIRPDHLDSLNNRANALHALKRTAEAKAAFEKLLAAHPRNPNVIHNYGVMLRDYGMVQEALNCFERALAVKPDFPLAHSNRGAALYDLMRYEQALASFTVAAKMQPDNAEPLRNMGLVLQDMMRFEDSLTCLNAALALKPDHAEALANRGFTLQFMDRPDEAVASFKAALTHAPDHPFALGGLAGSALHACDWNRTSQVGEEVARHIRESRSAVLPFVVMGYSGDEALLQTAARRFMATRVTPVMPLWTGTPYGHEKIRVAYLSADFHRHATAYLMAELFERHDRERFEIVGISYGPDDGSEVRARLIKAFDSFHDVRARSDLEVAQLLRQLEVDIAIDLKGHTQNARTAILSHRPCPVQVNYLGYPGTMGGSFIDYIIGDPVVLPFESQRFYDEQIVQLPDSYQPNDTARLALETPTRAAAGLPEKGFVFCCFNNSWKITAPLFDIWMRLLKAVPDSVLWLIDDSPIAKAALESAARERGVDPARLTFVTRISLDAHLARHQLADLFLDTLPYNAHTTASDALWVGVPIVTCRGASFAGRVAAGLLNAIGLPELVTENLAAYEQLALELAQDPKRLKALRDRLAKNRDSQPLFDIARFTRNLEKAYTIMWQRAESNQTPQGFRVPD